MWPKGFISEQPLVFCLLADTYRYLNSPQWFSNEPALFLIKQCALKWSQKRRGNTFGTNPPPPPKHQKFKGVKHELQGIRRYEFNCRAVMMLIVMLLPITHVHSLFKIVPTFSPSFSCLIGSIVH